MAVVACAAAASVVLSWSGAAGWIAEALGLKDPPHKSDRALIETFQRNRAEFEHLREMIVADTPLQAVSAQQTWPEDPPGISASRIAEYRSLLKKLGIRKKIWISDDRKTIEMTCSSRGISSPYHNSQKGYAYYADPADLDMDVVDQLDSLTKKEAGLGLRRLEGNWYLFFVGY
jgi:hypothetical protein